jgi:hypothetical protein
MNYHCKVVILTLFNLFLKYKTFYYAPLNFKKLPALKEWSDLHETDIK